MTKTTDNPDTLPRPLQPGDNVLVFEDPHTRTTLEGEALLLGKVGAPAHYEAAGMERWNVTFTGENAVYMRVVHRQDRISPG